MNSKEKLVETMSDLIWERGYAATSPREVRERSGVGQGSMYYHFPSKRDLGIAAIRRNCETLLPRSLEILKGPGDPMDRLVGYLSRDAEPLRGCKVGRLTQDPEVVDDPGMLAPIEESFAEIHRCLVPVVDQAIAIGELPGTLDAGRLAHLLTATIQGGYVLAIAAQDRRPFDEARAGALDLLRAAAGTAASGSPIPGSSATGNSTTARTTTNSTTSGGSRRRDNQ
ncbi:MAG: TetR/AcrR family transcriptional regulator [Acidipropionibacterium sp.]|jgi:AcrR family transcriptional regulator|nr:TetR/AcrR family transcriptional regulator [Acidipropionibacterium sp.]